MCTGIATPFVFHLHRNTVAAAGTENPSYPDAYLEKSIVEYANMLEFLLFVEDTRLS